MAHLVRREVITLMVFLGRGTRRWTTRPKRTALLAQLVFAD